MCRASQASSGDWAPRHVLLCPRSLLLSRLSSGCPQHHLPHLSTKDTGPQRLALELTTDSAHPSAIFPQSLPETQAPVPSQEALGLSLPAWLRCSHVPAQLRGPTLHHPSPLFPSQLDHFHQLLCPLDFSLPLQTKAFPQHLPAPAVTLQLLYPVSFPWMTEWLPSTALMIQQELGQQLWNELLNIF